MPPASRRVVITGIGAIGPLGLNTAAVWEGFLRRRSGVRRIKAVDVSGLPVQIAGEIEGFDAKSYLTTKEQKKALRVMARTIQLAVAAAQLALDDGRVDKSKLDPTRFGVEFGAGLIASELHELADAATLSVVPRTGPDHSVPPDNNDRRNALPCEADETRWGKEGIPAVQPLWMLKYLPNMLACQVSIFHDAQGPNNSITETDVASTLALGEAYRILLRDGADFFLVGGAESRINPLSVVRQCLFESASHRNHKPEKACRPFEKNRDGLVIGEGGTVLVVEDLEHARKRGATILAEVVGFGAAFDLRRDGKGLARALRQALDEAGITPDDVDHVNAHGLSTVESDVWEARAVGEVFGSRRTPVPVFAPKSYTGNLGAAGWVSELAVSVLGLRHGVIPGTLNYDEPDPSCPVFVPRGPRPVEKPYFVKLSFTQAGQCGAVVIRKFTEGG